MRLSRLVLHHFRSYDSLDVSFPRTKNYLLGHNGRGKTNILEALNFLSLGRSFRTLDASSLIQEGYKEASIYIEYENEEKEKHSLSCLISRDSKTFAYDGEKVASLSKILGKLLTIVYDPSLVFFFKDEPERRRKLLDEVLSQLSKEYLYALGRYKKLLKERNCALAQNYDQDVINVLRDELINLSYRISNERKKLVKVLSSKTENYYSLLFGQEQNNTLSLLYKTNCPLDDDQKSFVEHRRELYERSKSYENIRHQTRIGPHRDDRAAILRGKDVARYGSQGENRLASLSVKLSVSSLYQERLKTLPILLLDDITSDLDEVRTKNLLTLIGEKDQQVFVTGTRVADGFQDYEIYQVADNRLTKEEKANG